MALIGEPYLVTFAVNAGTSGTLRLFRKVGNAFVQVDSLGVNKYAQNTRYPRPAFTPNGFLGYSAPNDGIVYAQVADARANSLTMLFQRGAAGDASRRADAMIAAYPGQVDRAGVAADVISAYFRVTAIGSGSYPNRNSDILLRSDSGAFLDDFSENFLTAHTDSNLAEQIGFSPDGQVWVSVNDAEMRVIGYDVADLVTDARPFQAPFQVISDASGFVAFEWAADSSYLVAISKTGKKVVTFERTAAAQLTAANTYNVPGTDSPVSLTMFGPYVAVGCSYDSGGIQYRTRIYKRAADQLIPLIVLEGIGKDVRFLYDGSALIDAGTKTAYDRAGDSFTENTDLMVNVNAAVEISAVSPHINVTDARGYFYTGAAADLVEGDVVLTDLKVALVNGLFNPAHATMTEVFTATPEVFGNGWPEGGIAMTTVTRVKTATGVKFSADLIEQNIFGGTLTSRAAVIYEVTPDRPIIYLDFGADRTVENNSQAEIDFTNGFAEVATN